MPVSLIVVVILFILFGISELVEMLVALAGGTIQVSIGILGIPIGIGLLSLRPEWRICALVVILLWLFLMPILGLLLLFGYLNSVGFDFFGIEIGHTSKMFGVLFMIVQFAVGLWAYRVLTRQDVRRLYQHAR